jgi:hypothetical protein
MEAKWFSVIDNKRLKKWLCLFVLFMNSFFGIAQNANEYLIRDSLHTAAHRVYEPMRDESILYAKKHSVFVDIGPIFRSIVLFGIERKWSNHLAGNIQLGYYGDDQYNFENFIVNSKNKEKGDYVSTIYALSINNKSIIRFASALEMKYKFKASNSSTFIKLGYRFTTNTKTFNNTYQYVKNNLVVSAGLPLDYRIFTNFFHISFGKEIIIESQRAKFEPAIGLGYQYAILNGRFSNVFNDLSQRIEKGNGTVRPNCFCNFGGLQTPIHTEESEGKSVSYGRLFIQVTLKFHFFFNEK